MNYRVILFDAGDTPPAHTPSMLDIYIERMELLSIQMPDWRKREVSICAEAAWGAQIQREQDGAPRMDDEDFHAMLDEAALQAALGDERRGQMSALRASLRRIPLRQQELAIIPHAVDVLLD